MKILLLHMDAEGRAVGATVLDAEREPLYPGLTIKEAVATVKDEVLVRLEIVPYETPPQDTKRVPVPVPVLGGVTFEAVRLSANWAVFKVTPRTQLPGDSDRRELLVSGLTQGEAMILAALLRIEQALTAR